MSEPASASGQLPGRPGEERLTRRDLALILVAVLPLLIALGTCPLWKSEGRWYDVAQEMLRTGNWLEPTIPMRGSYLDKPLLSYWAILAAAAPSGRVDEVASRLPSALSGALAALLTAWMAGRLLGRACAVAAAAVLASSYYFLFWSRAASADLLSLLFGTAAVAVYLAATRRFRPWHPFGFWMLLALGGQSKGMPAVIPPLAVASAHWLLDPAIEGLVPGWTFRALLARVGSRERRARLWVAAVWSVPAILLSGAVYFLPFYLSFKVRGDWELLRLMWKENFERALNAFDHRAPWWYYFWVLPLIFLPWGLWLPGAIGWGLRSLRRDAGLRFAAIAFAVIFALFTASESRRSYYILPVFPFAALLVAGFWRDAAALAAGAAAPERAWRLLAFVPRSIFRWVWAGAFLVVALGWAIPGPAREAWGVLPRPLLLAGISGAGLALLLAERRIGAFARQPFLPSVAAAILFCYYYAIGVEELRARGLVERPFALEVKARIGEASFVYFPREDRTLMSYLGTSEVVGKPEDIRKLLDSGRKEVLVVCAPEGQKQLAGEATLETRTLIRTLCPAFGPFLKAEERFFLLSCALKSAAESGK